MPLPESVSAAVTRAVQDKWYHGWKKEQLVIMRRHTKAIFDSYSRNPRALGGSTVDEDAFGEMMKKHGKMFMCANFDPRTDMPELDQYRRVTFPKFEL